MMKRGTLHWLMQPRLRPKPLAPGMYEVTVSAVTPRKGRGGSYYLLFDLAIAEDTVVRQLLRRED